MRHRKPDHDRLAGGTELAAVARQPQRLVDDRTGADVDAHLLGHQRGRLQIGQHRVMRAAARRLDVERRIAGRIQAAVGAHLGHEGVAFGVADVGRIADRLDGREVLRHIQAGHVLVELLAADAVGGLEQRHHAARDVRIGFDAGRNAVLGAAGQVIEAHAGVVVDGARRQRMQCRADREGERQTHAGTQAARACHCFPPAIKCVHQAFTFPK